MRVAEWMREQKTVEMSHGRGTYVELGSGDPVLMLHGVGFAQGAHEWFLTAPALAERFRVIMPDFVGWGAGSRLQEQYSFARLVDFVREFQDRLGLASSSVVGHSMGGWVASLLAYESPERVDRLVLVGSGGLASRPLKTMTSFTPPTLEEVEASIAARCGRPADEIREWAEYGWGNVQNDEAVASYQRLLTHMTNPETRMLYNLRRRLPLTPAETLVLWGTEDAVNDIELGRETAELMPRAELATLPCGHFPHTERPEEFTQKVRAFLESGASGGSSASR
jgi:pimeloyl-ACP methyl ester carboxylesterase